MDDRTLFFFGACCKRGLHLCTTTAPSCCISASYCHLSATLQTMSIIVVNLQNNRAVFRIFIAILILSFDSPSCYRAPDTAAVTKSSQMNGACSMYGDTGDVHIVCARKFEGNSLLGRYKRIWEDIIKSYLNKCNTMVWNVFIWSGKRDTWQNNVKAVMNFWVP